MHQVYHPGFANEVPYAVVMVELEEGCKFVSNLLGVKPHDIKCGMPVEVCSKNSAMKSRCRNSGFAPRNNPSRLNDQDKTNNYVVAR